MSQKDIELSVVDWNQRLKLLLPSHLRNLIKIDENNSIFPYNYCYKFKAHEALFDLDNLIKVNQNSTAIYCLNLQEAKISIKIYSTAEQTLASLMPNFENLGLYILNEESYTIEETEFFKKSWLYIFEAKNIKFKDYVEVKERLTEALAKIFSKDLISDSLCKLITTADFNWLEVKLFKALTKYLQQIGFSFDQIYIASILVKHSNITILLKQYFETKFKANSSKTDLDKISVKISQHLARIIVTCEDQAIRSIFCLIKAIVRTNFFKASNHLGKVITFKFDSSKISFMPKPVPYREIFVYSNEFEAIHLRGGKIARGGIRWSDRAQDYRSEILGLMKAQMTKNSIIVPVGSKGGFFLNFSPDDYPGDLYKAKVIQCYQAFLRALLEITDNIIDETVVLAKDIIAYDEADPYLVVAADKGTASFSDYANSVAHEHNYWLGDAFASGGSRGYDHKKLAITAKGAFISANAHLETLNIEPYYLPKIIGIGDMSGDVFGNGMLLSKKIKLVAAFNHSHIFIDPEPELLSSYQERLRLFDKPNSNWSDYKTNILSKGGAIYERAEKILTLSLESCKLLNLVDDKIRPNDLIKYILKADVDLIFNGGIGTYIKASHENHKDVCDKSNDPLRVDANEVKAKVIVEGGNLGITQAGRLEFSKGGGLINTDFIDNSAGVDCSDHEVNIKIAFAIALKNSLITQQDRDSLLTQMTEEIVELVLRDNYEQVRAIDLTLASAPDLLQNYSLLIDYWEKLGLIERALEFLPSKKEIQQRIDSKQNLERPEIAVILSYSKNIAKAQLNEQINQYDEYYNQILIAYFPTLMHIKFKEVIINHPLKKEIITTCLINNIFNKLGGAYINDIAIETGAELYDIIKSYSIAAAVFDLNELWLNVEKAQASKELKFEALLKVIILIRRSIIWFIKYIPNNFTIEQAIKSYKEPAKSLISTVNNYLNQDDVHSYSQELLKYSSLGNVGMIAISNILVSLLDVIYIAKQTSALDTAVTKLYFDIGDKFELNWLRLFVDKKLSNSYWQGLVIQTLKDDFYNKQRILTITILKFSQEENNLDNWLKINYKPYEAFMNFMIMLKKQEKANINMLMIANKKLDIMLHKIDV